MYALKVLALSILGGLTATATAADKAFTGTFEGTGRACSGALYVRTKTIEWNSTYSRCKPTEYDILEKQLDSDHKRVVFNLKAHKKQCRYPVIEIEHVDGYSWNVSGYQSLEGFQKRNLPEWSNSPLPERQILSCPMIGPD